MQYIDPRWAEKREGLVSIVVNVFVSLARLLVGVFSGSSALIAEAIHSFSDTATSTIVIVGGYTAAKPPDKEHPYGHGKLADILSLFLGLALVGISIFIALNSITRFVQGYIVVMDYAVLGIIVICVTSIVKEYIARYALKLHRDSGSTLCRADAWHHRLDALLGLAVLPVFVLLYIDIGIARIVDILSAILISSFICREGIEIMRESIATLIDEIKQDIVEKVESIARSLDEVAEVHDIRARSYGGYIYVEMKIHVDPSKSVEEAHRISEEIERKIKSLDRRVVEVLIHIEPTTKHD